MDNTVDLMQIKIDKARAELPEETREAIDTVDWRAVILGLRESKGYSFEQLGDLETETELLLCGLINPAEYPKELETRMKIPRAQADFLVNEMNDLVFSKIREELIKNTERKKIFGSRINVTPLETKVPVQVKAALPTIAPNVEVRKDNAPKSIEPPKLAEIQTEIEAGKKTYAQVAPSNAPIAPAPAVPPSLPLAAQKLSGTFQMPAVKTDHSVANISKSNTPPGPANKDPYRVAPE